MPEKMQGMGAIPGVGIGYIMKAGQALDGYLAAYQPGTVEEELEKLDSAVAEVADILEKSVEQMRAVGHDEQANIMEAHLFLAQDPMLTDGMTDKVQEMGNAPAAILASAAESAKIFQSMDDEYLRERAADVLDVSKRIAGKSAAVRNERWCSIVLTHVPTAYFRSRIPASPRDRRANIASRLKCENARSRVIRSTSQPSGTPRSQYETRLSRNRVGAVHGQSRQGL